MADPQLIDCPADQWTIIATNVTSGVVHIKVDGRYLQTYRDTGNPAPTDISDAMPITSDQIAISAAAAIDVYIRPVGQNGRVRVDL